MMKYDQLGGVTLVLFIVLFLAACNQEVAFNKEQWNERTDPLFPSSYRVKMLKDLTTNYKLVGLSYAKLIERLGLPDGKDSTSIMYKITVDYAGDIDPVYTKNLRFNCSKDSIITAFEILEWKK